MTEPARPKQHWIPAVVLGGFSADVDRPKPRDRRLHVQYRSQGAPRITGAKNLAYVRGLYDWDGESPPLNIDALDDTFNPYERRLPEAFRQVAASSGLMLFEPWIRTLVPYVAGLTVRAPHFLAGHRDDYPLLQLQMSRWIEMTRAVAPLMAADWYLLEALADCRFVINDRGFAWASDQPNSRVGLLVPITARYALVVFPCAERLIARLNPAGVWLTALPQMAMTAEGVAGANAAIARDAVSWYAGAEPEDIADLTFGEPDLDCSAIGYTWPDRGRLGTHDQDWSAAMRYAGFSLGEGDWQPFGILSSIEPGVRPLSTPQGLALHISFLQSEDPARAEPEPEGS